ncbi:hypothetical protein NDS46_30665 (plasmid) [Paenibacillus thiaminolyticus]|uniref:hypothetical protein n=1 Tax=Paenibacillus thiaminolyticus TaxID=49283 RepID=UPI00232FC7D9|nr:hypothetical protein [Paenibacillus thiaminolyticus]WCF11711.1 hypothetical protein NDS46_30665 [Paenibacillus thiaminolyticus]
MIVVDYMEIIKFFTVLLFIGAMICFIICFVHNRKRGSIESRKNSQENDNNQPDKAIKRERT